MNFSELFERWPSSVITRNQLHDVTGGLIHPKTMRILDCKGKGIEGKFSIGHRTVAYPVKNVVAWLEKQQELMNQKGGK